MSIDHNPILSRFFHHILKMINHRLTIMIFAEWYYRPHIACFHRIIPILFHKLKSFIHMTLIISVCRTSFMMHNQFHILAMCIFIQFFHVKVRIRSHIVKIKFFPITHPIFPSDIPPFYQNCIKTIFCGKVDISFHILTIRPMIAVRFCFRIISFAYFYSRIVRCVIP